MNYDSDYQDIFFLKTLNLPIPQNDILAISVSSQYLLVTNKRSELYRWVFDQDDSLKQPFNLPLPEKEKGFFSKIFCDLKSYHSIIRYNKHYFYFNTRSQKLKQLTRLSDISVESVAFDETAMDSSPNTLLLGTDKGRIYSFSFDYDFKLDKVVNEKLTELIQLKEKTIYGLSVSKSNY